MHRTTITALGRNTVHHAAKGRLPLGTAPHHGKPGRPPLARRHHHLKHRGHRAVLPMSLLTRRAMSDNPFPCRGSDGCVWGDLLVALLILGLFWMIVYVHALLPPLHP